MGTNITLFFSFFFFGRGRINYSLIFIYTKLTKESTNKSYQWNITLITRQKPFGTYKYSVYMQRQGVHKKKKKNSLHGWFFSASGSSSDTCLWSTGSHELCLPSPSSARWKPRPSSSRCRFSCCHRCSSSLRTARDRCSPTDPPTMSRTSCYAPSNLAIDKKEKEWKKVTRNEGCIWCIYSKKTSRRLEILPRALDGGKVWKSSPDKSLAGIAEYVRRE